MVSEILKQSAKKIKIFEIHTKWVLELTISSIETFKRVSNFTENMMAVYSLYVYQKEWLKLIVMGRMSLVLHGPGVLQGPVQASTQHVMAIRWRVVWDAS